MKKIEKNETFSFKMAWKHLSRGKIYSNGLFNFVKCRKQKLIYFLVSYTKIVQSKNLTIFFFGHLKK